uniref:Cytochrome P450 n=1 Tax=Parastrongyloides trichosuri TaxID=131310 RepID=A0A0N4Z406_PARTI
MILLPIILTLFTLYVASNINKIKEWWYEKKRKAYLGDKIPGPKALPIFGNMLDVLGSVDVLTKFLEKENKIGIKNKEPLRRF